MVVLFRDIGTTQGEDVADYVKAGKFSKPLVAYVAGRNVKEGMRFGHAGAIVEEGRGTAASKVKALEDAGVRVAAHFPEIGKLAREALKVSKT